MLIFGAVFVTGLVSTFDLFYALEPDQSLVQYEVEPIDPNLDEAVLEHIAEKGKVYISVRSEKILNEDWFKVLNMIKSKSVLISSVVKFK